MRDHALLFINNHPHEIRAPHAFLMLSDYLRYHQHLTGTKVVCAEGDCGACAVLVGTTRPNDSQLHYRPITSCIAMMAQLDATHIVTIEGLDKMGPQNSLHPIQKSMAACNGAQCGYCTPGIVVALAGLCENAKSSTHAEHLTDADIRLGLSGNLCRCTGYESILKAGTAIDCADVQSLNAAYPPEKIHPALAAARSTPFQIQSQNKTFYKPTTLPDACTFKQQNPHTTVLSGGTDLGVLINKSRIDPQSILSLSGIENFSTIDITDDHLSIGGGSSLSDFEAATESAFPQLLPIMRRHGSPLIRNAGTLAGNIVNGSPIGDTMPALMVLNAEIEITGSHGIRRVNINHFYTGYRKTVLHPDELVSRILIPRLQPHESLHLYKVSKRWDLDISTFTAAFWIKSAPTLSQHPNGNRKSEPHIFIEDIRIAYGGVGPTILRLPKTESLLKGQPLTEKSAAQAGELALEEITPISDVRSSADYRSQLAENILLKWFYGLTSTDPKEVHDDLTNTDPKGVRDNSQG